MLELLARLLGGRLGVARHAIMAAPADEEVVSLLRVDVTQPILVLRRPLFDADNRPVELSTNSYRADRYHYEVELPVSKPVVARWA